MTDQPTTETRPTCIHPDGYDGECPCPTGCGCCKVAARTTPDNPLRDQLAAAIESEVYEFRERTMFWEETVGVTQEIARLATRGAMEATTAALREQRDRQVEQTVALVQRNADLQIVLAEVLGQFVHPGHPGEPCLQTGWVSVKTVDRWRAVLYPPASDGGPTVADDRAWPLQREGE